TPAASATPRSCADHTAAQFCSPTSRRNSSGAASIAAGTVRGASAARPSAAAETIHAPGPASPAAISATARSSTTSVPSRYANGANGSAAAGVMPDAPAVPAGGPRSHPALEALGEPVEHAPVDLADPRLRDAFLLADGLQ